MLFVGMPFRTLSSLKFRYDLPIYQRASNKSTIGVETVQFLKGDSNSFDLFLVLSYLGMGQNWVPPIVGWWILKIDLLYINLWSLIRSYILTHNPSSWASKHPKKPPETLRLRRAVSVHPGRANSGGFWERCDFVESERYGDFFQQIGMWVWYL